MIVSARPAPGSEVAAEDFMDIPVPVVHITWGASGLLDVGFAGDLTAEQVETVVRRIESSGPTEEQIRANALQALANNKAYLALETTTAAQDKAQLRAVTRQMQGVIRLALGRFDAAE